MPVLQLGEATWDEIESLGPGSVAILPVGAIEAHGPHLPLATDEIIAAAMAEEGSRRLSEAGRQIVLLPPLVYSPAPFARNFAGTISIRPDTMVELIFDIGMSLVGSGLGLLAIANAHLDPVHLDSIDRAVARLRGSGASVAFPNLTRKPWGSRLSAEFKSGACHAGRFEGSVIMARRRDLVRESIQSELAANPVSLSGAIQAGLDSFEAAGGANAYFGDPAGATLEEGRQTVQTLGEILEEAVLVELADPSGAATSP